jgi:MFS family permease
MAMTQVLDTQHDTARGIGAWVAGHRGTLVVVAATLVVAMGFGGLGLITVFMRPMEAELGWSRSDTSLGYAFSTAGMAIGGLWWGRLSDRVDVRLLLALGAAGMIGPLLAMSALFYVAHLVYGGLGFSVLYSPLLSTSGEWFPERRGLVMGIVTAGGAAGQGLLPFFASLAIKAFGWRWAFVEIGCAMLVALALTLPWLRWPQGFRPPAGIAAEAPAPSRGETSTVAMLAIAAFFCCLCMGVPVVHLAGFVSAVCGSASAGATSMLVAMISGAVGRVFFGSIADRIGPLKAYAVASFVQTACVVVFPLLQDGWSLMALSALFGLGFAGNMTCLSLCVREAVPASRFGGAIGAVMMVAWAGMAAGGYAGGVLFDLSLSYTTSFVVASAAGVLNLAILGALQLLRGRPGNQMDAGGNGSSDKPRSIPLAQGAR